ncbi:hypothetical protein [Kitasatospora herbaricolor]|uniref:Streptogrisin C n=1 Tax=Kitasatospora herbaricolor TaxID=68217 RepID=A0ABZ1W8Y3_9ACTN|nr:hypothetical protein [Kitasatospora herbaricolor]
MNFLSIGGTPRRKWGGRGGTLASGALLLTVLASLVGQTDVAQAAPARPAAASSPQAPAAAPGASPDAAASAGTPDEPLPPAPKVGAQPAPRTDPKAEHEAAARSVGQGALSAACPAALEPSTTVSCSVEPNQTVSFALTLPQQKDLVLLQVVAAQGWISSKLVAPDGATVTCENVLGAGYAYGVLRCATGQAGVYALQIHDNNGLQTAFSASYVPLLTSAACKAVTAADRKLGAPTVFHGSLPAGSAGDCYTLDLAAGDVLRGYASTYQVVQAVYDATGKELCNSQRDPGSGLDCALAGTAPFRVTVQQSSGAAQEYGFTAARLSRPEGCAVVEPQAFGVSPDVTGTVRCRVLRAPQAARYAFAPVGAATTPYGGLFSSDGTVLLATCGNGTCDLTPGDYVWVVEARNTEAGAFGMAFHSAKETRGCVPGNDNGLAAGPATGTFGGPGQQLCLTLPTASGNGLYLLNRPPAGGTSAGVVVQDASGAQQCDNNGASYAVCRLTGTAPFRAVLSGTASQAYQLVVHRTGEAAGCGAWPQSPFGGSWGAEVP